jgi:hypothetical protein
MLDVGEFSSRTAPVIAIPLTVFPGIGTAINVATEQLDLDWPGRWSGCGCIVIRHTWEKGQP